MVFGDSKRQPDISLSSKSCALLIIAHLFTFHICVYVSECMYLYVYVCVYVCIHKWMYLSTYVHTLICLCVFHVRLCVCKCVGVLGLSNINLYLKSILLHVSKRERVSFRAVMGCRRQGWGNPQTFPALGRSPADTSARIGYTMECHVSTLDLKMTGKTFKT